MTVSLLAVYAGLTISLGASGARVEAVSLDPWVFARSPGSISLPWAASDTTDGFTLPALVWMSSDGGSRALLEHEWSHVRQTQALGFPVQLIAYAGTGGRAFEDYLDPFGWRPRPWSGRARCPLLTITPPSGGVLLWACSP